MSLIFPLSRCRPTLGLHKMLLQFQIAVGARSTCVQSTMQPVVFRQPPLQVQVAGPQEFAVQDFLVNTWGGGSVSWLSTLSIKLSPLKQLDRTNSCKQHSPETLTVPNTSSTNIAPLRGMIKNPGCQVHVVLKGYPATVQLEVPVAPEQI